MTELAVYGGLFLSALVAATILPAQSEAVLVGLLLAGHPPLALVAVASVGNVLGSLINWLLGRGMARAVTPPDPATKGRAWLRAEAWYRRWGQWSLLLSWVPILGDPLTVIAGLLREPLPRFLMLVTIAKTGRYLVLTAITLAW